jgi:hypothetical protein
VKSPEIRDPKIGTRKSGPENRDPKIGTRKSGPEIRNPKFGSRISGPEIERGASLADFGPFFAPALWVANHTKLQAQSEG